MSGEKAERPYYIENISTNIYSIEELCFYLYNNIYLLDSTILGEELCFWIRDELGLKKLAAKLYALLDQEPVKAGDFILPIFKEINYLSLEEFRKLNQRIQRLAQEPEALRQKMKGDYLMEHNKYVNAIRIYQKALACGCRSRRRSSWEASLPVRFTTIWAVPMCVCSRWRKQRPVLRKPTSICTP